LGVVYVVDCERVSDCMMKLFCVLAYSTVCGCMFCGVVFSFAMIINMLIWAEVRTPRTNQDDGGSAS